MKIFLLRSVRLWPAVLPLAAIALWLAPIATPSQQGQAPAVAGVKLGMEERDVRSVIGEPEREASSLGMRFWEYPTRGITVIWQEDASGATGIVLSKRNAGGVRGVRVYDSPRDIIANWGPPLRVRNSGRFLDFAGRGWTLSAEIAAGRTVEITLLAVR